MRNKYGKLFIKLYYDDGDGKLHIKDESIEPLLNYVHSEQYKDLIIEYDKFYFSAIAQNFGSDAKTFTFGYTLINAELSFAGVENIQISVDSDDNISIDLVEI